MLTVENEVRFVDLTAQMRMLKVDIMRAIEGVLDRGDYILGESVSRFEEEFADYCGVAHAIGVDSGFSALELSLRANGIGAGDEVITHANTFIATVGAILAVGATPVLVDCDAAGGVDASAVDEAITERTRAIMPVHMFGLAADLGPLRELARRTGAVLIEDACQAHGARVAGRRAGSFGDAAAFSFYPAKNLGALGDGGMIVTHSAAAAEELRAMRNCGQRTKYVHVVSPPLNRRLDTLQAAALRIKLPHLDSWNADRERLAAVYRARMRGLPLTIPGPFEPGRHVYHLFVIQTAERDALKSWLERSRIHTGIHYPTPVHLQPALASLGHREGEFPNAERLARTSLSLPMYPELAEEDVEAVSTSVGQFYATR